MPYGRLTPLEEAEPVESFLSVAWPTVLDSVPSEDGMRARMVVTVLSRLDDDRTHPIRIVTLDTSRHALRELRRYRIPGDRRWLVVWSCESFAWEGGYEMQFPVLLGDWRGRPDPICPEAYDAAE
jgi:hypothetical protein